MDTAIEERINKRMIPCFSCGALVEDFEGPVHAYMKSSPGCWRAYGEIVAKEYAQENYDPLMHRITVDTYAIQHPGTAERRSIQSVNLHLIRLYLVLHNQIVGIRANAIMKEMAENLDIKKKFVWMDPPSFEKTLTVVDVLQAIDIKKHAELVQKWGLSVLNKWIEKHKITIKHLIGDLYAH